MEKFYNLKINSPKNANFNGRIFVDLLEMDRLIRVINGKANAEAKNIADDHKRQTETDKNGQWK
jgi:hypothetical protein